MSSTSGSSIAALQRAFRDPSSPFYLAEGEVGPASPDELPRTIPSKPQSISHVSPSIFTQDFSGVAKEARKYAFENGYDPDSFYEHKVMWGEIDSFRHVNNVHYARYIESSRLQWFTRLYDQVGGPTAVNDFLAARGGVGVILKSLFINYKRPIVYPDTLLIAHRVLPVEPASTTRFKHEALVYSFAQNGIAATGESVLVWYNYDKLEKSPPSDAMRAALEDKIKRQEQQKSSRLLQN